ncbi:MAG: signal peptidase I [Candidatus Harrisonbacteria bacterium CG10_big_fil_rev_8_21_14_0_10_44_23]|uniref:Signal peptidase I n=1 Tax=Candidatus Harrisonbacteria bacterium CG10_big_fil_rev_8_21_14_0_10_44_23 TaxID=1974585 RepID=A0A2H0UQ81_9BACT|nr:MAG: signal peptidase I [Candidatus Harrisonbacteria bacterium CG10_big_fil_rev_8_21_14_0_10_44_23]
MRDFIAGIWEILEVVLIALLTVFFIRSFIMQPFLVSGASMEPNFEDGNYLLIDEATYYFREPARGEVIVFHYPADKSSFFIKRVIGLPGERVVIESGSVKIAPKNAPEDLRIIDELYLDQNLLTSGHADIILQDNEYFVLGDNRSNSFDSRNWGTLSEDNIVGLVRLKLFPFSEFGTIAIPSY